MAETLNLLALSLVSGAALNRASMKPQYYPDSSVFLFTMGLNFSSHTHAQELISQSFAIAYLGKN